MQTATNLKSSQIDINSTNNNMMNNIKTKIEQKISIRGFKSLNRKSMFSPTCLPSGSNVNINNNKGNTNTNQIEDVQILSQLPNKQNIKDTQNLNSKNIIKYTQHFNINQLVMPTNPILNAQKQNIKNNQKMSQNIKQKSKDKNKNSEKNKDKINQQNDFNIVNTNTNTNINNQYKQSSTSNTRKTQKRNNSNGFRYLHGRTQSSISNSKNKQNQSQKQNASQLINQNKNQTKIGQKPKSRQRQRQRQKKISLYQNSPISNYNYNVKVNGQGNQVKEFGFMKYSNHNINNNNKLVLNSGNRKNNQQLLGNTTNNNHQNTNNIPYRSPNKYPLYVAINNNNNIICETVSKDGNYKVISRALSAQQLKQASQLQHHINLKSKKQAIKQLQNQATSYRPSSSFVNPNSPRMTPIGKQKQRYVLDPSKISSKQNGIIKAYAVNSNQGISRKYNEDRVSIILNIMKNGVKASFFAIYDGHGGASCCDYLTQNLHQFVFNSKYFPAQPRQALVQGMKLAETKFVENVKNAYKDKKQLDKSGSCAIILLIVGDDCYIANLGDSRAVLSTCNGKPMYSLSRDHKPTDTGQQQRILKQGGKIYRTQMTKIKKQPHLTQRPKQNDSRSINQQQQPSPQNQIILGPLRVFPGKLSVTRTFGDIQAKQPELGGIKNCISTDPQICKYTLSGKQDFILLGCDGLFQKLDSEQVIQQAWKSIKKSKGSIHEAVGSAAQSVVKLCMDRRSTDNITAIIVALGSLNLQTSLTDYASV